MADDVPFMGSLSKEDLDLAREVGIDTSKYTPESALTREGYRPVEKSDYETSWSDYYRGLVSGGAGVVSGLAGGAEYLTGGALGGDTRRYFGEISDDQIKAMSPVGRRAIQAEFLPEQGGVSVLENLSSSLGLKTVSALPSLVASIIPAGIAVKALQGASLGARALGAGVATRGTAGLMAGGDVAGQIYSEVEKLSDKDLQERSELYAGYRSMMPEADARRQFMQEVAGAAPAAAALISAAIGGAEGQVAGRLAGKAATGVIRGVGQGARAEAAQEAAESGVGELLAQLALTDQNLAQMNWQKILSKGLEGATIGGIMGGGVGGISGLGARAETAPPPPPATGVVPTKGYGTGTAPAPAEDPTAGNPQSAPSGSETQYPKGKTPSFTIDTVRSRLEAQGIEFPENRLSEINDRIAKIRRMKKGERGSQFAALLDDLYAIGGAEGEVAPGVSISAGPDAAQVAAMNAATPVQKVQAPPSVMAPPTPPPVADALGNLTTPRAPAPPPVPAPAPARGPKVPTPVAAAVGRRPAQPPIQSEVQPIGDNYIKFGNAQVELQADGIGWKPAGGQSTIFYATGKGPGTRRRGEAHLSGMAKAGVPAEVMPIFTDYANGKIGKDQVLEKLRGLEAKVKQRQSAAPKAPVDTGTNLQQPAVDLLAEQEELISGQRAVQMFPTNTTPLKLPKGMKKSKTSRGVFHYNPDAMLPDGRKVTEGLIQRLSVMGRENELLGLGDRSKQEVAAAAPSEGGVTTVSETTPEGARVRSAAATVADAERQAQAMRETAAPQNNVVIEPSEQALVSRVSQGVTYKGRNVVEDLVQKQREEEEIARRNAELDRLEQASEARRQDKVAKDTSDKELQVDEPRFLTRMRKIKKALGENAPEGVDKAIQLANQRKALGSGKSQKKIDITKQIRALQKIELEQRTISQTSSEGTANVPAITRGTQVAEAPKPKKLGRPKKNLVAGTEEESAEAEIARLVREQKQEREYDRKGIDKRALGSGGMREEETQREISDERDAGGTIGEDEAGRDTQEAFDIEPSVEVSDFGYSGEQAGRSLSAAEEKAFEDRIKKNGQLTNKIQALLDDDAATEGQKAVARVQLKRLKQERNDLMQEREDAVSDVEVKKAEEERQARLRKAREEGYETVAPTKPARVVEVLKKRAPIKSKPDLKPKAAAAVAVAQKTEVKAVPSRDLISKHFGSSADAVRDVIEPFINGEISAQQARSDLRELIEDLSTLDTEGTKASTKRALDMFRALQADLAAPRASMPTGAPPRARISATPTGPTVTMAGVDFTPIQSTNVSRSMKMVSDEFYKMFRSGPDRLFATFFRNKLTQRVGNVPVHVATPDDMERIYFEATGKVGVPNGIYHNGAIALNVNTVADPISGLEVAMHEALHAWSENAINSNPGLQRALDIMVARGVEMDQFLQSMEGKLKDKPTHYGLTDRYEFVSEAFSSPDFRAFLRSVELSNADRMMIEREIGPVKGPFKTALDAFLQLLRSAMGLPDTLGSYTLLDAVMRAGAKIDAIVEQQGALTGAPSTARASIAGDTLNAAGDMQRWLVGKAKRGAAMFANNRNLAQQYANTVIGPGLQQIVDAVSATLPRAQEVKEAGDRLASRSIKLAAEDPEEFRKLTEIMQSARMMSISIEGENFFVKNPNTDATKYWQAKARFKDLQAQFASLKNEEMKQLYRDMAAFYRNTHNDLVQSKVTSILENLGLRQARGKAKGTALTDAQIADLTQRVMNQEMTPADKELLGTAMYNSLKNAADFHRVEGDYFPLMRYGDYVVTTSDKIKDTMGGKLEEPDTVLFRDKSNTVARRAAENFVKKSEILHLSTEKVYFDNATNTELKNEDEAKSYNDVDIGYRVKMQTKGVYFFESGMEAETFARTNPEGHDTISNPEIRMGSGYQAQVMTGTQVASMNSAIDARVESGNITEGQGALLKSIVNEAATRMLTGNRIASRRLKAKKVTGASTDVARNLLQYNASAAREIATSENMPLIRDGLDKISKAITGYAGSDRAQLVAVVDEIKARVDQGIVAPNEPSKYMKDLMSVVFLARLFSPAYTVINGMQPWMVTAPVLGGKFGGVNAVTALGRAYSDIGFGNAALQGMMNTARAAKGMNSPALLDTRDIFGDMRAKMLKASDGDAVVRMLDELARLGAIDKNAGLEVSATTTEGRGRLPKIIAGVDRIARQLPQMMEAVNRTVSATAAYRLARQGGQTHEEATRFALDTVTNTQGDYSAANAPRFFNNPILRPALMFKKYAQMMTYLLGDMAYRAFKGATPEERKVALSQLGYILGVQIAVAGALSLPGLEIIKAGFLLASFLGIGGGWDEVEEKLRKALDETVGKPFGQMISSGILTRLGGYGIDVSQRMSLADMWLFGEPKSDTSEGMQAYLFRQVAGAPGGYVLDVVEGFRLMVHEGEVAKGLGRILPAKFAADTAKALHGKSESAYEKDAEKKTVSGYGEIAANIFGFKTARQAEVSRRTGANIREFKDKEKESKQLLKAFRNARTKGDQIKAIAKNIEFNATLTTPSERRRFALPTKPRELRTAQ